jgi:hypothetical protein
MKHENDGIISGATVGAADDSEPARVQGEEKQEAPEAAAAPPAAKKKRTSAAKPRNKASEKTSDGPNFRDTEKYHTTEQLVEAYNEMVLTAVDLGVPKVSAVTMFASVDIGAKACERLHGLITKAREADKTEKEKPVKKAKKTAAKKSNARKAVKGKTSAAKTGAKRGPRMALDENAKIVWAGKDIPYRGGRAERTEVVRKHNGKTVRTFVDHGGNTQTLRNCVKAKLASLSQG